MYQAHFGMTDLPFRIAPDPRYYLDTPPSRAALAALLEGLARGDEFLLLTGDVGAGKTTVARQWLAEVDRARYGVGEIFGSHGEGDVLLDAVVQAFGIRGPHPGDAFLALERFIDQRGRGGRELLLLVDEAQDLGLASLRRLAQLTAMRAGGRGVLHVGLVGHHPPPAIEEMARLGRPLPVGIACRLRPFDAAQTREYVLHRLQRAGWSGRPAFGAAATYAVHECSGGVPRRINVLCDRILLWQFMEGAQDVSAQDVMRVHEQLQAELGGRSAAQPPPQVPVLDLAAIVSSFESPPPPAARQSPLPADEEDEPAYEVEHPPPDVDVGDEAADDGGPWADGEAEAGAPGVGARRDGDGERARDDRAADDDEGGFVSASSFGRGSAPARAARAGDLGAANARSAADASARRRWSLPLVSALVLAVLALLVWQGVRSYMGGFVRTPPLERASAMGSGVTGSPAARPPPAPSTSEDAARAAPQPAATGLGSGTAPATDAAACPTAARTLGLCAPPAPPAPPPEPAPAAPAAEPADAGARAGPPPCDRARAALGLCPAGAARP